MQDREDAVNKKKQELFDAVVKLKRSKSYSDLEKSIFIAGDVCTMLQDMYIHMRDENQKLKQEVKKLKSVINTLTT